MRFFIGIIIPLLLLCPHIKGQIVRHSAYNLSEKKDSGTLLYIRDTTGFCKLHPHLTLIAEKWGCKSRQYVFADISKNSETGILKRPFLAIHGNVYYDVYYQSNIDTPYFTKNLYQHTIRTYLDVKIKDDYPVRIGFSTRFSNSSLLQNITGLNLQFNSQEFKNNIRNKLINWLTSEASKADRLNKLKQLIIEKQELLASLKSGIAEASQAQRTMEQREEEWLHKNNAGNAIDIATGTNFRDSLTSNFKNYIAGRNDSLVFKRQQEIKDKKEQYDSLNQQLQTLETTYNKYGKESAANLSQLIQEVKSSSNLKTLAAKINDLHPPDSVLPKGYTTLLAVKSFGIGRTIVDYSELTAKGISITGIQAAYNPASYYAVASGYIDYRYHDFIINEARNPKQYLNILRFGRAVKDGNSIIFSYYTGKKQLYNYTGNASDSAYQPDYRIMGVALEGKYKINANTFIAAEIAKSSLPSYNRSLKEQNIIASAVDFKDRSNEAYSLKVLSYIPQTATKLTASYKYLGAHFQSFSLFNSGAAQRAWLAQVDQSFFKKGLSVTAAIRTNDFTNPYLDNQYYSNTVFKSIQAILRIKKYPAVAIGYFPSSQLTKLGRDNYIENLFYTLTGSISHCYNYRSTQMATSLLYTRFYNRVSDSNFVYFNTHTLLLSHSIFLSKLTFQTNISAAANNQYHLYVFDQNLQYKINKNFSAGGGLKYNRQTKIDNSQLGYTANIMFNAGRLGMIQLLSERNFIPDMNKQLVKNDIGRLTYFKTF